MPSHSEKREVFCTAEQLFELVADIEKYPEFLPWCKSAVIKSQTDNEVLADLTVGFGPFKETYTSRVSLDRPKSIKVTSEKGPFEYLSNYWTFTSHPNGCLVDFNIDFQFRSRLLRNAIGMVFGEAVRRMVRAFTTRAQDIYSTSLSSK